MRPGRGMRPVRRRPHRDPACLALHVDEERGVAAALRHQAFALLRSLARFLAVLAADRERQRAEPALGDFVAALEAVAEGALFETVQRFFDLVERLRLHLDERELDLVLDVGSELSAASSTPCAGLLALSVRTSRILPWTSLHDFAAALLENAA